jgi:hypothetical protein
MRQRSEDPSTDSEKGTVRQENGSVCQLGVQLCGKEELPPPTSAGGDPAIGTSDVSPQEKWVPPGQLRRCSPMSIKKPHHTPPPLW